MQISCGAVEHIQFMRKWNMKLKRINEEEEEEEDDEEEDDED